jgi:hypothetical protein
MNVEVDPLNAARGRDDSELRVDCELVLYELSECPPFLEAFDKDDRVDEKFKARFLMGEVTDLGGGSDEFLSVVEEVLLVLVEVGTEAFGESEAGSSAEEELESVCSLLLLLLLLLRSLFARSGGVSFVGRAYLVAAVRKPGWGKGLGGGTGGKLMMTVASEHGYAGGAIKFWETSAFAGTPGTAGTWTIGMTAGVELVVVEEEEAGTSWLLLLVVVVVVVVEMFWFCERLLLLVGWIWLDTSGTILELDEEAEMVDAVLLNGCLEWCTSTLLQLLLLLLLPIPVALTVVVPAAEPACCRLRCMTKK